MESFLIYLLKSVGLLSVFFLFYITMLRKDTSFKTNRKFLVGGLLASAVLPAIYFTRTVLIEAPKTQYFFSEGNFPVTEVIPEEPAVSPLQILFLVYLLGSIFMAVRLLLQLISLRKFFVSGKKSQFDNSIVIESNQKIAPFSFLNYIVYNPSLHSPNELRHILKHEKIHVVQLHTFDVMLANFNLVYQWFNPFAWLYLKNLQQNLEYIADDEAVKEVSCKKEYQKALVKISLKNPNLALTNNFYQSLIKKRIVMLNKSKSSNRASWKTVLILLVLVAFLVLFNIKTVAQVIEKNDSTSQPASNLKVSVNINESTTQEQLNSYTSLFDKYDVQLNFKEVQYNDAGLLTSITAEFLDRSTNKSGSLKRNNSNGIKSFTLYYKKDGGIGFGSGKSSDPSDHQSLLSQLGKDPLIVLEGKTYTTTKLAEKTIKVLGKISSLTPSEAEKIYGNTAKDGALIINKGKILDDFEAELNKIDKDNATLRNDYIQISKGTRPSFISLNNNPEANTFSTHAGVNKGNGNVFIDKDTTRTSNPVYIVNGKIVNATTLDTINPSFIDSIQVFKGANATSLYGRSGKNGLVAIHTRNDTVKSKHFKKQVVFSTSPTVVKNQSISITSSRGADGDSTHFNRTTSYVRYESDAPFVISADSVDVNAYQYTTRSSPGNTFHLNNSEKEPLYVINERIMGKDYDMNSLDPQNIASINVLQGKNATDKYGEKARDGVLEITTKELEKLREGTKPIFTKVSASTTKEGLKITQKQLKEQANLDVTFDDVKRNNNGLITHITISAKRNGSSASATYEVEKGIPDVFVGVRNNSVIVTSNPPGIRKNK
ncbi:TonB-dependent receptor plug domain-containing protein [Antarcticibacterium sp. 1MA-6-2]|uniref:M56 family metallopeptidase n=1 Tax=Antarcticibacterium sp. 1MA-6-2 TaxID=2908210 RepID=UPI001F2C57BB|nr:M56 family metallopeptidase [Antarcticibacterium sp. 1MA-6-2]UJH92609.1 TonB-dependent receptor plug domain-containing protein [Antarcticibacterium sp. 1MA-6-2]